MCALQCIVRAMWMYCNIFSKLLIFSKANECFECICVRVYTVQFVALLACLSLFEMVVECVYVCVKGVPCFVYVSNSTAFEEMVTLIRHSNVQHNFSVCPHISCSSLHQN